MKTATLLASLYKIKLEMLFQIMPNFFVSSKNTRVKQVSCRSTTGGLDNVTT
jgi:hypothetical protein